MPEIIVKLGQRVLQRYFFDKDVLTVGRARDNDIVIENLSVSRNHVRLKRQDGKYSLIDMNSSNGTLVNGVRITKSEIVHDDQITIGKHTLHFLDTDAHPEASAAPPVADHAPPSPAAPASGPPFRPRQSGLVPPPPPPTSSPSPVAPPPPPPPPPALSRGTSQVVPIGASNYEPEGVIGSITIARGKQEGQKFRVYKADTTIGRAPHNDVRLHDWLVSNKHAAIRREGDTYLIRDLGSWRGTELNGSPLKSEVTLQDGAEIVMGTTVLVFSVADANEIPSPKPVRPPDESSSSVNKRSSSIHVKVPPEMRGPEDSAVVPIPPPTPAVDDTQERANGEDEFAPFTEDELEALDSEIEVFDINDKEEIEHRREVWDMTEAEKMFEGREGQETFPGEGGEPGYSLIEPHAVLKAAEERINADFNPHEVKPMTEVEEMDFVDEEMEEEEGLYGGEMTDAPPYGEAAKTAPEPPTELAEPTPVPKAKPKKAPPAESGAKSPEVQMWEKAMKNKSKIIRKNAARELKKLTGREYDWESEPSD